MDRIDSERLASQLRERYDEGLRAVAYGTRESYEFLHVRENVADAYADSDRSAVKADVVFEGIDVTRQERLYSAGTLGCTVRVFDRSLVYQFIDIDDWTALVVSLDPAVDPALTSFVEECRDVLGDG